MKKAYQKYLEYVDSLKGIARLPYMTRLENPPDLNYQYFRNLTFEEFCDNIENMKEEFLESN